jgi:hypothetical protein
MRHRLVIVVSVVLLLAGAGSAVLVARGASAANGLEARRAPAAGQFVGYWMGIDPLDGGDSRRGITRNADGTFSVIGRDTVFTLCDNTDRAVITLDDARIAGSELISDSLLITCLNNGSTVSLRVRYAGLGPGIIRETVTTQAGEHVDEIIFHRVSER